MTEVDLQGTNTVNLRTRSGQTIDQTFTFTDNGSPYDLTDKVVQFLVTRTNSSGVVLLSLTSPDAGIVIADNVATVFDLNPDYDGYKGVAYWQLIVTDTDQHRTFMEGLFTIL
jgi:hypothetical protein